jgi:hypothetical protein
MVTRDENSAAARAAERGSWPVARYRLGNEPGDDLSSTSTPEQRLAMMWQLAIEAFALTGQPFPSYTRAEAPVARRRLGE